MQNLTFNFINFVKNSQIWSGGGNAPPNNLAFLSVGGNFKFLGGIPPPLFPPKYPCSGVDMRKIC